MVPLEIPEWGGLILMQDLSGADRSAVMHSDIPSAMFALRSLVDSSGKRLFSDYDLPAIAAKSAAAIYRIREAGLEPNGLGPDCIDQLVEWFRSPEGWEERAYYAIAKKLHMTVHRFLAEAPSLEISKWVAIAQIESDEMEKARDAVGGGSSSHVRAMGSYDD